MDLQEDEELLGRFVQQYQATHELRTLKRRHEELQTELKQAFATIDTQATTLRRYRTLLRQMLDPAPSLELPVPPPASPLPTPPPPRATKPLLSSCTRLVTSETPPEPVPTPSPPPIPTNVLRCGDLIQDQRIRRLSPERSDGFKEVYVSNIIWQTIVQFFNDHPNANLMDEQMIIKACGQSLLTGTNKPYLTRHQIHQYFDHPFTFQPTDQTMVVRTRLLQNQQVYMVFIPDWLKSEWRTAGRVPPPPVPDAPSPPAGGTGP